MKAKGPITFDRPEGISSWIWLHHTFADLPLWQNCIVAAHGAEVKDVVGVAQKMYAHNGGLLKPTKNRHNRRLA